MDIALIVNITSKAWALPILAAFHAGVAGRQAPLLAATGASRSAFAQSLKHLMSIGVIERNPGYGHPLRPEFRLTSIGVQAAALAHKIHHLTPEPEQDLLRRAWTVPVLTTLQSANRFNAIKKTLNPITDRALSQSLQMMEARHWVSRDVDARARPPRALYHATHTGSRISEASAQDLGLV